MGNVEAIYIATSAAAELTELAEVTALAGRGLAGDRYAEGTGTYSSSPGFRNVTLIEAEAIDALDHEYNVKIEYRQSRRNILTRGVALNHLVGREFIIGETRLRGMKLCEPCNHLEKLTGKEGTRKGLVHRGGLRADIIQGGVIRKGDPVRLIED